MCYEDRVKQTLERHSTKKPGKRRLCDLTREWVYNCNCFDLGSAIGQCELCGHTCIRFCFEIENRFNHNRLLVGSECIRKFRIPAVDANRDLMGASCTSTTLYSHRNRLISEAQHRNAINLLVELASVDQGFDIDSFIAYYSDCGAFTPNQMSTLLWRLEKHGFPSPHYKFKISLKKRRDRFQLAYMDDWKVRRLWPFLTDSQRHWYKRNVGSVATP